MILIVLVTIFVIILTVSEKYSSKLALYEIIREGTKFTKQNEVKETSSDFESKLLAYLNGEIQLSDQEMNLLKLLRDKIELETDTRTVNDMMPNRTYPLNYQICNETFKIINQDHHFYEEACPLFSGNPKNYVSDILKIVLIYTKENKIYEIDEILKNLKESYSSDLEILVLDDIDVEDGEQIFEKISKFIGHLSNDKFILIAVNLLEFYQSDTDLKRLIRELNIQDADIASGSSRYVTLDSLDSANWADNCGQLSFKNWTLTVSPGYKNSKNSCLKCSYLDGPLLFRSSIFPKISKDRKNFIFKNLENFNFNFFVNLEDGATSGGANLVVPSRINHNSIICPDVMFSQERVSGQNVQNIKYDRESLDGSKNSLLELSKTLQVSEIKLLNSIEHSFTCQEADLKSEFLTFLYKLFQKTRSALFISGQFI